MYFKSRITSRCKPLVSIISGVPRRRRCKWLSEANRVGFAEEQHSFCVALSMLPPALKSAVSGEESAGQAAFVVLHPPGEQLLAISQYQRKVGRIVCDVAELTRILLEIEEQRCEPRKVH